MNTKKVFSIAVGKEEEDKEGRAGREQKSERGGRRKGHFTSSSWSLLITSEAVGCELSWLLPWRCKSLDVMADTDTSGYCLFVLMTLVSEWGIVVY